MDDNYISWWKGKMRLGMIGRWMAKNLMIGILNGLSPLPPPWTSSRNGLYWQNWLIWATNWVNHLKMVTCGKLLISNPFHLSENLTLVYFGVDGFMSMTKRSQAIWNDHNTKFSGKEDARGECKAEVENNLFFFFKVNISLNSVFWEEGGSCTHSSGLL